MGIINIKQQLVHAEKFVTYTVAVAGGITNPTYTTHVQVGRPKSVQTKGGEGKGAGDGCVQC